MKKLAGFFPGVDTGWASAIASAIAGSWEKQLSVRFIDANERSFDVSSNFELWSEGNGDRRTTPGLGAYVRAIVESGRKK